MNVLNVVAKDSCKIMILFGFENDNFKHQDYLLA